MNKKNQTVFVLLFVVICFAALFVFIHRPKQLSSSEITATVLPEARLIKPFKLLKTNNQIFTQDDLKNHWTLLFFGFTHCDSVCPTTMAILGQMYRILEEKNIANLPQVIMVTIDPKHDDLKGLSFYVKAFDPHFYGARGSKQELKLLADQVGVAYTKFKQVNNNKIEHTGTIMLIDPKGKLWAFFTSPHQPAVLAHDYILLTQKYARNNF
jgi:protein SCO1